MEQQQQTSEAPAFGRKIFFLNPSFSIRTHIVEALKRLEYEVYTFTDYKRAKAYMRIHRDAMLYVNTETQMTIPAWINFFRSLKEDMVFSTTIIGVCCDHLTPVDLSKLQGCPYITAGIFHVEGQFGGTLTNLMQKMDSLGAKGRRQYVRTACTSDPNAGLLWISNGRMFKARLIDISAASVAILVATNNVQFLNTKSEIFVTLQLDAKQVQVRAKSLIVKPKTPTTCAAIFMITEGTPDEAINTIREYVFTMLERDMLRSVEGLSLDKTNYAAIEA